MKPNQMQQTGNNLSLEDTKAALGTSNRIMQDILRSQNPQTEETLQEPESEVMAEPPMEQPDIAGVEERLMSEIQSLKELMSDRGKQDEIEQIRRELQELIEEEYDEEGETPEPTVQTELNPEID